jgi:hypothetical protein
MEGMDVSLGMVSKALSSGREETVEENGCLPFDILFLDV